MTNPSTPRRKASSTLVNALADSLRTQPNKWAKLPTESTNPHGVARDINNNVRQNLPSKDFEATVRADGVYIRYIGDAPQPQATTPAADQAPTSSEVQQLLAGMAALTAAVTNLSKHFE